ncbi:MAG: cyclic nucleotide-binding domain-containing protein [Inquilinus sp.]|nr:cyclic nucleotide-binding domain-containing protein [Inquilinus sp.]
MPEIAVTLLVLAVLAAFAGLLEPLARRLMLPHSVLLAGLGLGLGALAAAQPGLGLLGDLENVALGADTIVYLFLPVLLFQTGLTIDVRRMLDDIAPVLLLAIVAVVVCTVAVGLAVAAVSEVGLVACLLLGAIVATTDPVAVVGIFRDIGAPRRLSILIEGESVFNDAAAIALFSIMLGLLATGGELDGIAGTATFVVLFAGGVLVGAAGGWLTILALRPVRGLAPAEVTITVAGAYLTFILGEAVIGVSGVVAVVIAALIVGSAGRTRISPESWQGLTDIWNQLGFWASTLVFVLASLLAPRFLAGIGWGDAMALAALVAAAFAARAAVLYGLLPVLSASGLAERVSGPYKAVILWGGLRGAVTLALALAVTENAVLAPEVKRFVGALATGFVLFTLLANATTLRPMMRLLKLHRLSPVEQAVRDRVVEMALASVAEKVAAAAPRHHIAPEVADEIAGAYRRRLAALTDNKGAAMAPLSDEDQLRIGLFALSGREEELYLRHFADQTVSRRMVTVLVAKAGRLRDAAKSDGGGAYLRAALDSLRFRLEFRVAAILHHRLGIERFLANRLADRFETLLITRMVLEELVGFARTKLAALFGTDIADRLRALLDERLQGCTTALQALRKQYPDYARALEDRFLRKAALRMEQAEYRALLSESMISPEIHDDLLARVFVGRREVEGRPKLDLGLDTNTLVQRFPMFEGLPEPTLKELCRLLRSRLAYPGERIVVSGERGDAMYFISSGVVEVERDGNSFALGTGDFFGELAMLANRRRTATVTAVGYCRLLVLGSRDFRRFLRGDPGLRARIREIADQRLAATGEAIAADHDAAAD